MKNIHASYKRNPNFKKLSAECGFKNVLIKNSTSHQLQAAERSMSTEISRCDSKHPASHPRGAWHSHQPRGEQQQTSWDTRCRVSMRISLPSGKRFRVHKEISTSQEVFQHPRVSASEKRCKYLYLYIREGSGWRCRIAQCVLSGASCIALTFVPVSPSTKCDVSTWRCMRSAPQDQPAWLKWVFF